MASARKARILIFTDHLVVRATIPPPFGSVNAKSCDDVFIECVNGIIWKAHPAAELLGDRLEQDLHVRPPRALCEPE